MRLTRWTAAAALALVAGLAPATSAAAASASPAAGPPARAGTITNDKFALNAVSAVSSSDAWAVGTGATTLHWDGTSWVPVTLPGKAPFADSLSAVDALSPSDVWAVGVHESVPPGATTTLIVHWTGAAWARVPSPGPSNSNLIPELDHLSMDSATDGWATGGVSNRTTGAFKRLVLHWNGTNWQRVTTSPGFALNGVASFSPTDATAVGGVQTGSNTFTPAVFHWNGTSWAQTATLHAPSGVSATSVWAYGLSADSATDMWATGGYQYLSSGGSYQTGNLAWHWNGTRWTVKAVPSPNGSGGLLGVAAISPANVWAVGYTNASKVAQTVSVHWNGTSWTRVATPDPGTESAVLYGVAAAGPRGVWAVGYYNTGPQESGPHTLTLRWNGTGWVRS